MNNNWLLWGRFAFLNTIGFIGLAVLYINGYVQQVIAGDSSGISILIFVAFLIGLVITGIRVYQISRDLNYVKAGRIDQLKDYNHIALCKSETAAKEATEIKLLAKIQWIQLIASSLVSLGLIGTVFGTIVFMLGLDVTTLSDIDRIGEAFVVILNGLGIALYTTLTGAIFNLWLSYNYAIVEHGASHLLAELVGYTE